MTELQYVTRKDNLWQEVDHAYTKSIVLMRSAFEEGFVVVEIDSDVIFDKSL